MPAESLFAEFPETREIFYDLDDDFDEPDDPVPLDAINMPPQLDGLFKTDALNPPYARWLMRMKYVWHEGICMMPLAAPPSGTGGQNGIGVLPTPGGLSARQSCKIVRHSAPWGLMAVYWNAVREVYQPEVPIPTPPDSNTIFVTAEFEGGPPDVTINSAKIWHVSGRYLFYLKKPIWVLDNLNMGQTPLHTLQKSDNTFPQGKFTPQF